MAAITWEDVVAHAPELRPVHSRAQLHYIALVTDVTNLRADLLGGEGTTKRTLARVYLAAHLATMDRRRGIGGAVTATSLGDASRNFAMPTGWRLELEQTSYGLNFLALARTTAARAGLLIA